MDINFKQCNQGNYKKGRDKPIEFIIIHYTANNGDKAESNIDYFARTVTKTSAHYFVDENSVIWQSVKDIDTAWHCGSSNPLHPKCRNANSIGIEMCSRKDANGKYYIKPETVANAVELTKLLMETYGVPLSNVLRHYDVTRKMCPEPFVRDERQWAGFKGRLERQAVTAEQAVVAQQIITLQATKDGKISESNIFAMQTLGIINSPDYWRKTYVKYLDELLAKALMPGVLDKRVDNGISDLNTALKVLTDAGVVNASGYWVDASSNIKYVRELLINISNRCLIVLEKIVHAEACGEGIEGQILVGNVIQNRLKDGRFPNGIYNVVFQSKPAIQFTPVANGAYDRAVPSDSVKRAVDSVLNGQDESKGALYFCSKASAAKGNWHERELQFLFEYGGHRFYK